MSERKQGKFFKKLKGRLTLLNLLPTTNLQPSTLELIFMGPVASSLIVSKSSTVTLNVILDLTLQCYLQ